MQAEIKIPPKLKIDIAKYKEKSVSFDICYSNKHSIENLHILTKLANRVNIAINEEQLLSLEDDFKEKLKSLGVGIRTLRNDVHKLVSPAHHVILPIETTEKIIKSIDFKLHLDDFYSSAIIIDGSNALLWNVPEGEKAKVADLEFMIKSLKELGFSRIFTVIGPSMAFRVDDKRKLEHLLMKPRWIKAPPTIDSDIVLLDKALEESGYIISNDKFDNHKLYAKFLHKRCIVFHYEDSKVRFYWAHNQKQIKGKIVEFTDD